VRQFAESSEIASLPIRFSLNMTSKNTRPKLVFNSYARASTPQAGASEDDFAIYMSYSMNSGLYSGRLKIIRKTDDRILFPFDGAPSIGPFKTAAEALKATRSLADEIIAGDLRNPEL
jgi:hypothetical protein